MESLAEKKLESKGNYDNWDSCIKHLRKYTPKDILFSQLDKKFVEGFREYLTKTARTPANNRWLQILLVHILTNSGRH